MLTEAKHKPCHEAELPGPRLEAVVDLTQTDYELFSAKLQAGFWDCAVCSEASGLHLPAEPTQSSNLFEFGLRLAFRIAAATYFAAKT